MRWLEQAVAEGRFSSVEEAVRVAVADLKMSVEADELEWARPYIEEDRAEIERGEGGRTGRLSGEAALGRSACMTTRVVVAPRAEADISRIFCRSHSPPPTETRDFRRRLRSARG